MNQSLDFLFFPHPLSVAPFASTSASDSEEVICYLYGWIDDQTAVVAGGIEDISVKNVESRLSSLAGSIPYAMLHRLAIIGVCGKLDTKGKAKASEGQITISLSFNGIPSIDGSSTTIITFTPPSPSQLQFLSLDPLQLDLASFSTPLTDSVQIKRDDSRASEHSRLSRNVKTAISLDFTASSKSSIHKINLQNVIDKVRSCHIFTGEHIIDDLLDQSIATSNHTFLTTTSQHKIYSDSHFPLELHFIDTQTFPNAITAPF